MTTRSALEQFDVNTASAVDNTAVNPDTSAVRIASIDIFRGLTVLVMIFVNDLSSVHGLPWWTYHALANQDAMTYVDMVFPFFLFIVGMSMPLAINRRLEKNPSMGSLWLHVLSRSAGLVVLGLILANAEKADPVRMGLNPNVWALLGLAGAVLFWFAPSRGLRGSRVFRWLRVVGLALLILTFALFRRSPGHGTGVWIDGSYPEILGLIGYTYLAASILYIPTRRWLWSPLAWMVALTAFCAILIEHHVRLHVPLYFWPFGSGALASVIMAGVVTSSIFLGPHRWQSLSQRMQLAFGFAAAMFVSGWLLTPLGISKIRATPTWCLYSSGAAVLCFALLYWVCDVAKKTAWARLVRPAGENTLLTYLLPDFYFFLTTLAGFTLIDQHFSSGALGVARAAVFTLVMLGFSALLTRSHIRLQL
jgi:heparan-alpha-glucosaminide N-acetyltransferase